MSPGGLASAFFWLLWLAGVAGLVVLHTCTDFPWQGTLVAAAFLAADAFVLSVVAGWPDDGFEDDRP